ncbi:MAG: tail fiber protein [Gorillibacterium sp.]|nr:tail fiber protein [Gorillibacterium sp.]
MAAFGGLVLTNKGRNLQAKIQTGVPLVFNRIGIGDGSLTGQQISDLTALISLKLSLPIAKLKTQSGGKAIVGGVLSNQDVTIGFYFREIGVFAQDPDVGEILYCYGNAGSGAEYIPASGGADIVEKNIDIITLTGNASSVTAQVASGVYALAEDVGDMSTVPTVAKDAAGAIAELYEVIQGLEVEVPDASLTVKGKVQLSSATNSTSETMAATAKAVKDAYDRGSAGVTAAAAAQTKADAAQLRADQAFTQASDGKTAIAAAITGMGQAVSGSDTFAVLASKVADISDDATAAVGEVLTGKTFYQGGGKKAGTMPNRSLAALAGGHIAPVSIKPDGGGNLVVEPYTGYYTSGVYENGYGSILVNDPDFVAANIRNGVNIFGLVGSMIEGKQWASGSVAVVNYNSYYRTTVSGLNFRPNYVISVFWASTSPYFGVICDNSSPSGSGKINTFAGSSSVSYTASQGQNYNQFTLSDNGFSMINANSIYVYTGLAYWIAFG